MKDKTIIEIVSPAFAAGLYRDLTGDKRLSDVDAQSRAMPLLWHPSEDEKIRKRSFADIKRALNARIKLIQEGRYTMSPEGDFITPLDEVLKEAGIDSSRFSKRSVVKTGTYNGKKVVQYSDGSIEYAK